MNDEYIEKEDKEVKQIERSQEDTAVNQYEIFNKFLKVHSELKDNIKSDYPLAVLNKDEREFIVENYSNSDYAQSLILRYQGVKFPKWNNEKKEWERDQDKNLIYFEITEEEKKKLKEYADQVFKVFMMKPHLITLLNRNRDDNFMLKLLGKYEEKPEEPVGQMQPQSFFDKIKSSLGIGGAMDTGE